MQFGAIRNPLDWGRWAEARALLGPDTEILEPSLRDGAATLWVAIDGTVKLALVTEILDEPTGRECFLRLCGGRNRDDWLHYLDDELIGWAKKQGCVAIEGTMRPGWERVFPTWKKTAVVLRREI